jgi:hypothetical protein
VVPGVVAFETIDFEAWVEGVELVMVGRLVLDDPPSRYVLERFAVERAKRERGDLGQPVTATGLRSVPLDFVVSTVRGQYGTEGDSWGLADDGKPGVGAEHGAALRARGLGDETALRTVAAVYLAHSLRTDEPIDWVAIYLDCSIPTASRWVAAAKDAGYLRVASRRRRD